jgi:iduronate 2-sulfatase
MHVCAADLRPSLSPYGQTNVHTPNIQKLADNATVFLRAYCQEAVCSPSRNSFLSGRRPDHTRAWVG